MKKVKIVLEVNDDFQPCTYGCEFQCPFGYFGDNGMDCDHIERSDDNVTCIVKENMYDD